MSFRRPLTSPPYPARRFGAEAGLTIQDLRLRLALRRLQAGVWRHLRARLFALPPLIRAYVRVEWSRTSGRRDPLLFSQLIERAASKLGASPQDFPHLDQDSRIRLAHDLDRMALLGDSSANTQLVYTPAVASWLAGSAVAAGAINLRQHALMIALADGVDVLLDKLARGREAEFEAAGLRLAVELHHFRPDRLQPSTTPWNADLCRRCVFVRIAGADVPLADILPIGSDE